MNITSKTTSATIEQRLAAIVNLARLELPDASAFGAIAFLSHDLDVAHEMLGRMYAHALEAERSYLAELIDDVLHQIEDERAATRAATSTA